MSSSCSRCYRKTKETWLKVGSQAHQALKEVVLDKKLLNDISHLTLFCHTGNLEAYHAMLTKYCQKREHFSYKGMAVRMQLAALDHNMNLQRKPATNKEGEQLLKPMHPKSKKGLLKQYIRKNNIDISMICCKMQ